MLLIGLQADGPCCRPPPSRGKGGKGLGFTHPAGARGGGHPAGTGEGSSNWGLWILRGGSGFSGLWIVRGDSGSSGLWIVRGGSGSSGLWILRGDSGSSGLWILHGDSGSSGLWILRGDSGSSGLWILRGDSGSSVGGGGKTAAGGSANIRTWRSHSPPPTHTGATAAPPLYINAPRGAKVPNFELP